MSMANVPIDEAADPESLRRFIAKREEVTEIERLRRRRGQVYVPGTGWQPTDADVETRENVRIERERALESIRVENQRERERQERTISRGSICFEASTYRPSTMYNPYNPDHDRSFHITTEPVHMVQYQCPYCPWTIDITDSDLGFARIRAQHKLDRHIEEAHKKPTPQTTGTPVVSEEDFARVDAVLKDLQV
jgi:hypothetical protein